MRRVLAGLAAVALLGTAIPASADVFPRASSAAGSVIARKTGEEVQFIDLPAWRSVDINQDLLVGDLLRTNAYGNLAVLFADNTQIRVGRNTTLVVKELVAGGDTILGLEEGAIWGRAEAGGESITIETPAAAAAIRGTDWSMQVEGDKTALVVLQGLVEFSNEFGSVSVAEGEAAVATIGSAPTKIIIVDPDDREQMLFFLSIRTSFNFLPVSPLPSRDMRAERERIAAIPEAARTAEDWLTLAEVAFSYDGRQAGLAAAAKAREFRLTASQRARLDFLDAQVAGAEQRYADAATLFARAQRGLDPRRRAVAAYGGYFARSLADPSRVEQPPSISGGGPYASIAAALTAGFLQDIPAAIEVLKRAEQQYPDDPTLPAIRAQFALLIDDREQVKEAVDRAFALDPDDPTALEARANYRSGIESDLEGAHDDLTRAVGIAPGSTTIWNALGLVESTRGAEREAEAALLKAIELDPQDPVSHANLAILYLDQDRLDEAKTEIDKALGYDPSFDIGLVARGRYYLQTGELDKAMQDLLAGSTANPAYSQALLMLAAGYYESGDLEPAAQAMENADRLDPNDPVTSSFDAVVAIDDYDADRAIASAQETMKRSRARGGDFASASANRDAGSVLNNAFRLQGLDAWGRYYGDVVLDPFNASGYIDQTIAGSANPFFYDLNHSDMTVDPTANDTAFSSFLQGLMLDPAMLSGRSRGANLFRRPFFEGAVGGGFINKGDDWGWTAEAEVQGYAANPFPWSFYGKLNAERSEDFRTYTPPGLADPTVQFSLPYENFSGTGYLAARPTPYDRVVAFVDIRDNDFMLDDGAFILTTPIPLAPGLPPLVAAAYEHDVKDKTGATGVAWSHTFGYRNVANVALFGSGFRRSSDEFLLALTDVGGGVVPLATTDLTVTSNQTSYLAAANHIYGVGDLTLRYGIEVGAIDLTRVDNETITIFDPFDPLAPVIDVDTTITTTDVSLILGRAYLDAVYEITPDLKIEAALFGTHLADDGASITRAEPRAGVAWSPIDGHYLRAGFMRQTEAINGTTLAPIGVLGLQANQVPLGLGGYADSFMARWDAEWTSRLFTSVDFQHQDLTGLSIPIPASLSTIDIASGRLDRASATANVWLGGGFGAFGTLAWSDSKDTDPTSFGFGGPLPFVPELSARAGLTFVHPSNVKVTLAATYVGERDGSPGGDALDPYWTTDAFLTWEPFDKRFSLELAGYNLFDQDFLVAPNTPGWGRTFTGKFKVRF
ncbi:MAG TPA: tetratricopeptide repeat protein [Rhizobiaceae bacterium]|nr:tetratricopeptide repeat protein [Rhizobiaceae bacterium]